MGSNQFQSEFIECLQKRNAELLNRLNHMKESYENMISLKDLNKQYLISTLEEVLHICMVIPQEIDIFFDKMTEAMSAFKDILLRKSELLQLTERISRNLSFSDRFRADSVMVDDSNLLKEQLSETKGNKKARAVKVSPMINGHIISTEPRIYLSRVPGVITSDAGSEKRQLSPIIEASPDTSLVQSNAGGQVYKEIKIPLEKLNLNKISFNYISEESPRSRFKGPKTWKRSLTSNKSHSDNQKTQLSMENNENLNKKLSLLESELPQQKAESLDPLEGPSWLYETNTEMNSPSSRFVDHRRRKYRFATVFEKNEDCINCSEETLKNSFEEDSSESYKSYEKNDEEEDFKENVENSNKKSFSNECDEKYSSNKKRRRSSKRESINDSVENNCKLERDLKNENSTPFFKKKKSISESPVYSDSFGEVDNKKSTAQKFTKSRKSLRKLPGKSSLERMSNELLFEKTPASENRRRETRISEKSPKYKIKNLLNCEVFVALEDCVSDEKISSSKRSPLEKKIIKKSKSKSKSKSPVVVLNETKGRIKRKAAPKFKLVEPKLSGKLRRE